MAASDPPSMLDLARRDGLPEALRVLLAEHPRQGWEADPGFDGLLRFWLDRHMMFRRLLGRLSADALARQDGRLDAQRHLEQLSRLGSMFVGELHAHHNIEDAHYFPVLAQKDSRVAAGFALLDQDHHAMDAHLNRFVERANAVLRPDDDPSGAVGRLAEHLRSLERLLDRHLIDEEELVVPVILKYGAGDLA